MIRACMGVGLVSDWVLFGEGTGDEMCFNFATAYPIDALPQRTCGLL